MAWRVQPVKLLLILLAALVLVTGPADARKRGHHHRAHRVVYIDPTPRRDRDAAIVLDAATGNVLYERYADETRYPASLTKMMTLYLLFEGLQKGTVSLSTAMTASAYAVDQDPTKLGLSAGDTLSVEDAIKALVVRSANDVAVVIAEHLGGSESSAFATRMTTKARELGMAHTSFVNASGLPDDGQQTTARDLATLGRHLISDFPQVLSLLPHLELCLERTKLRGPQHIAQILRRHGQLENRLHADVGIDLATSAVRRGVRLIAIVMGGQTAHYRDVAMADLLEDQFSKLGLGRQAPVLVSMSPLVPDDDETAVAQQAESAAETKPDATRVASAAPAPAAPNSTVRSSTPVPDDQPTINPRTKPVLATAVPAREDTGQGDTSSDQRARRDLDASAWGIQVGAYSDRHQAEDQLKIVRSKAADLIGTAKSAIVALDVRANYSSACALGPLRRQGRRFVQELRGPRHQLPDRHGWRVERSLEPRGPSGRAR